MEIKKKIFLPWSIFALIFFVGILIYKDYGVSSDELNNRLKGTISLNYVGEKIFPSYIDKYKKLFQKNNDPIISQNFMKQD